MALEKAGHVLAEVRDLDRSEAFHTRGLGQGVTGRLPGRLSFFAVPGNTDSLDLDLWKVNPLAGREPRRFQAAPR